MLKMNWTDWLSRVVQSTKMAFPPCVLCGSVALLWRDSQYHSSEVVPTGTEMYPSERMICGLDPRT